MRADFLEFTVGNGIGETLDPDITRELVGYRIVLERWVHPLIKGDDSEDHARDAANWISRAAFVLVRGECTVSDLKTEGYKFRLYSPSGELIADTISRTL